MINRKLVIPAAVAAVVLGPIALASPAEAGRTWAQVKTASECVPSPGSDAVEGTAAVYYTEADYTKPGTPAQGDETVPNPDYVAAAEAEYGFQKWKWETSPQNRTEENVGNPNKGEWKKFNGQLGWFPSDAELGKPYSSGDNDNSGSDWFRKIETKPASPAVGEPTLPNPDYVPAVAADTITLREDETVPEGYTKDGDDRVTEDVKVAAVPGKAAVAPVTCPALPDDETDEDDEVVPPASKTKCADFAPNGNFTKDDAEYAPHLDADKDGIACEQGTSSVNKPKVETEDEVVTMLPKTGADEWYLALAGLGLIGLGVGTVYYFRRRP